MLAAHSCMNYRRFLQTAFALAVVSTVPADADIIINEIHYDPPVKTELLEFVELHNTGGAAVDLSGWRFSAGVDFTFPHGTTIAAGGYVVVGENPAALRTKFGVTALGPWAGQLANDGEAITLRNAAGEVVDEVDYQLGFPWPTVGDLPGYSIELVNPGIDNDLGGSWRRSLKGGSSAQSQVLIPEGSNWRYQKGTAEPSTPINAWRQLSFVDTGWLSGSTPIGFDGNLPMGTTLADMRGSYTSFYMRKTFQVADPSAIGSLQLGVLYDDGVQIWINGTRVVNAGMPDRDVAFNELATGPTRESSTYDEFTISASGGLLRAGENVIAVQVQNIFLSESSDAFADITLTAQFGSSGAGPTPGLRNAVYDTNIAPQIRQVEHLPRQPKAGEGVRVTAKVTDPDGVSTVRLLYQVVDPGSYIELNDAAYETTWTPVAMTDNGTNGDVIAGDSVYTAMLPSSLQVHRRLVRYRIEATDSGNRSIRAPYLDDPTPNFACFVYNGTPSWTAALQPGTTAAETFSAEEMGRLPTYHLIAKRSSVEAATWNSKYTGDLYRWWGTLVYDGEVYDHIRYRARGGVWRYAMGKNMWKFDLNRGHDFQAKDNYGRSFGTKWRKVNLGANIQQGDFEHRGEQGMFESVGFRLFNMAGVESPKTAWVNYRVVDDAAEAPAGSQYGGDFWGLYLAIEQEDGRFLDEHDLPDGNLYKMEGGTGELNNQGRHSATDKSDLNLFLNTYRNTTPSIDWWRQNADLHRIYSYHSIVQAIHHYDIGAGKNYFYFLNPETGKWSIHSWDLDLTWADNMYYHPWGGQDDIRDRIVTRAPFNIEYRNRIREIRDLLYNTDQAWKLLDEYAGIVKGTNAGPNILAADRFMWDYNPIMNNGSIVNTSKAGQGRFYQFRIESANNPSRRGSFYAAVLIMKDYVAYRGSIMDGLAQDTAIPSTPALTYSGPANYPINRIQFRSSAFSGSGGFAAMKWRVGEVRTASPGVPGKYEIESSWESPEFTTFNQDYSFPAESMEVGRTYRARVKMKDTTGRWSHWSAPVEFTVSEPDNSAALQRYLAVTELMYNPPAGSDFEYVELRNTSTNLTLQLDGVTFVAGIEYAFPVGTSLPPGEYLLVVRADAAGFPAFRQHYGLDVSARLFGPYSGSLNNDGERIALQTAAAGAEIFSFSYDDGAGWPVAGDGTGHSIEHTGGSYEYGRNWTASATVRGSPLYAATSKIRVFINEFAAHTDYSDPARPEYDSNDWIEIYNGQTSSVDLGDYCLSDDASNLAKWRLPGITLQPGARVSFDEVTGFHSPITNGFGLDKAGEEIYLTRFFTNAPLQVVDAIRFEGQESGFSFGRHPDGGEFFYTLVPTRNDPNVLAPASVVISEFMYHPREGTNAVENPFDEFFELRNTTGATIALQNTNGPFRIRGGIDFDFPTNAAIPANGAIVLVSFNPTDGVELSRFKSAYQIQDPNIAFFGPFIGRLGNSSDRIVIQKPEAPDLPGEPVAWVIVDEVIYTDASGADGTGESLHRVSIARSGNDPSNFRPSAPTPGVLPAAPTGDRDQDGMPDEWESAYGLDPDNPGDATLDRDNDGFPNRAEFLAGTDPTNSGSRLALNVTRSGATTTLNLQAVPGKTYSILFRDDLSTGAWQKLQDVTGSGAVNIPDQASGIHHRYYRIVTPAQ